MHGALVNVSTKLVQAVDSEELFGQSVYQLG